MERAGAEGRLQVCPHCSSNDTLEQCVSPIAASPPQDHPAPHSLGVVALAALSYPRENLLGYKCPSPDFTALEETQNSDLEILHTLGAAVTLHAPKIHGQLVQALPG